MQKLHKLFGFLVAALSATPKYKLLKDHRQIPPPFAKPFSDLQNRALAVPTDDTFRAIFYLFFVLE
jgi:hypothetical protein